jgi:hypothetical protein
MTKTRLIPMAAAAMFAAACSASSDTSPNDKQLDISTVLAQTSVGDPSAYAGVRTAWALPTASASPTLPKSCSYSQADQRFDCAAVTVHGLTFKTSYYVLDATGASLTTTNAALAAAVRALTDITGTLDVVAAGSSKITINKHSDLTLSGLLSGPRVLNGSSTEHDAITTTAGTISTTANIDLASTTSNLVLPSATTTSWPQSGSITSDMNSTMAIGSLPSVTTTTHSVLTFNGTSIITIAMTISGRTQTCRIDLSGVTGPVCI